MSNAQRQELESETIEVYAIGTRVTLDNDIPAYITAINIRGRNVSYECNWWDERTRKSDWFTEHEFRASNQRQMIGVAMTRRQ